MEKKATIISLIVIAIIIASASAYIIFSGMIARGYNYVQIEVNPRVEFICDRKFDVVSVYPLNQDAQIVLSDLDLIGLDIEEASAIYLDECAKTGFIDVDGVSNATNITVIDGITQRLDVHVTKSVYDYFNKNEILSAVIETYEDRNMFDQKKKNKVVCSNKYKLIKTILETNDNYTMEELRKKKEVELVDIVIKNHTNNPYTPTQKDIEKKQQLIQKNNKTYTSHKQAITNHSQKEFSELLSQYQKNSSIKYSEDFEEKYNNWQQNNIS